MANISMDLEFMTLEILESIRPKMKIYHNFEEADLACQHILAKEEYRKTTGANSGKSFNYFLDRFKCALICNTT